MKRCYANLIRSHATKSEMQAFLSKNKSLLRSTEMIKEGETKNIFIFIDIIIIAKQFKFLRNQNMTNM